MKRSEILFGIAKIPADFFMTILAFLLAYKLRLLTETLKGFAKPIDYSVLPTPREYMNFSIWLALAIIIIFMLGKMYNLKTTEKFSKEIKKIILLWIIWAMAIITYFFFTRTLPFSRLAILYSWTLALIFIIFGRGIIRIIQKIFLYAGIGRRKLLFIGKNSIAEELKKHFEKDKNYKIFGVMDNQNISNLEELIKKNKIEEIIQTESNLKEGQAEDILEICDLNHVSYKFVPDLLEVRRTNISIEEVGAIPIISLKSTPLDGWGKVIKRILDITGAVIGIILFSPILIITAMAIKLDSKGPILFTKLDNETPVKRVGQFGKLFNFYKFRSMKPNTDGMRYTKLSGLNMRTEGPLVKITNDPRITRVGKFIRKYSIDELPQLWNVLIGNMSLVGPRPHLPEEVNKYEKKHRFVLTIKPGMTGIPQTSGRSELTFEDEVKMDRYYIENWSLWLDIKIIFKTLGVILKGYKE